MAEAKNYPPGWLGWSMWGLGAFFYLIGFYQRVAPAVMTDELMRDFSLSAAALGNLSGFYFYAYVAMQIPTGILADTLGPRRLLSAGALTAALGTIIFSQAGGMALAGLGRLMIGGSVAVAFVVLLKLAAHWFPPRRYAMVSGMALFCGVVGAVTAGVPLRLLVEDFGWRPVTLVSGLITLAVAAAVWTLVRNDPSDRGYRSHAQGAAEPRQTPPLGALAGLAKVFTYQNTWLLFLAPAGQVGPVLAFSGLWGVPYLETRYGLEPSGAAAVCSTLMIAWAVGSPVIGALSDRIGRRKPLYLAGCLVSFLGWAAMIYWPGLPLAAFVALIALTGFATGGMIVGFAFAKESVPPNLAGTVSGLVNGGVMLGPTILQPAMGWVLDRLWTGAEAGGVRFYGLEAYQAAFGLCLAWALAAVLLIAFTRDTFCGQEE